MFKKKNKISPPRYISHLLFHFIFIFALYLSRGNSLQSYFAIAFTLLFSSVYYGSYLLERIAISHNFSKNLFWVLSKFLSVIINFSVSFSTCYLSIYYLHPSSITNNSILFDKSLLETFFHFFHFSLGNFLGMDSDLSITGIPMKIIQIFQYFVSFSLIIFIFSNYSGVKESYSQYYKNKE
jgi:hypothetical protein